MEFKHIRATSSQSKSTHKSGASQAKLDHMLHENALECRLKWQVVCNYNENAKKIRIFM